MDQFKMSGQSETYLKSNNLNKKRLKDEIDMMEKSKVKMKNKIDQLLLRKNKNDFLKIHQLPKIQSSKDKIDKFEIPVDLSETEKQN